MESEGYNDSPNEPSTTAVMKYKGVYKCGHKFKAQIQIERVQHYLGLFDSEIEAAVAYDNHAKILLGSRARTNFEYNEDQANPDLTRQLFDTQNFSISRMEANMTETNNLPPKRKRGYASIQDRPPLDSLNYIEILSVKPKRERNVVARRSNNKKITSYVSTDILNEAAIANWDTGTISTSTSTGSNNVILSNISTQNGPIHIVATSETNSFISCDSETSETNSNTTDNLRRAAAMAALTTADNTNTGTVAVTTSSIVMARLPVHRPQQEYTLTTTPYSPTNPVSIEVIDENTTGTLHRATGTGTGSTYWAGVLYIDPVSELQVWKGTYTTTRPAPAAFNNNTNAFEYSIMPDPSTRLQCTHTSTITSATAATMTTDYRTVVTPISGTLVGSYLSSTTMTHTACSFQLLFEPFEEPGKVSMRYSALGSGMDNSGKFIVCGVYSSISGVLELRRLYVKD